MHSGVFDAEEVAAFCAEADRLALAAGSACVRHIRKLSPLFADLARSPRLRILVGHGLAPVRSILFDKTPDANWPVPWHQDLTIAVTAKANIPGYGGWSIKDGVVHVQPPIELLQSMATIRIHLDDATPENGALRVVPCSHRLGRILSQQTAQLAKGNEVVCVLRAGDVLVMSPLVLHASRRSAAPNRRRIVHFEFAPLGRLDPRLAWHEPHSLASPPG
jgi:ectoine hydroxylase-related dioxygenase (phytanoyl-CoA dioxygenase family)